MPYRVDQKITIASPIDVVWRLIQDASLRHHWDARVRSARVLNPDQPLGRGSQIAVVVDMGLPMDMQMEYLSWNPPYRSSARTLNLDNYRSRVMGSWQFSETEEGHTVWHTQVVLAVEVPLVGGLLEKWIGGYFDRLTQQSLRQFKVFAEARAHQPELVVA